MNSPRSLAQALALTAIVMSCEKTPKPPEAPEPAKQQQATRKSNPQRVVLKGEKTALDAKNASLDAVVKGTKICDIHGDIVSKNVEQYPHILLPIEAFRGTLKACLQNAGALGEVPITGAPGCHVSPDISNKAHRLIKSGAAKKGKKIKMSFTMKCP